MEEKTYNGWTNRETWLAALWIDANKGLESVIRLYTRQMIDKGYTGYMLSGKVSLFIEKTLHEMADDAVYQTNGLMYDLLLHAVFSVNTAEIAEHFIDDVKEDMNDEEND